MTEQQAIKEVEKTYGSLESFITEMFMNDSTLCVLDGTADISKSAALSGLSPQCLFVLRKFSQEFKTKLDAITALDAWDIKSRRDFYSDMAEIAANKSHRPTTRLQVAEYLDKKSGIEPKKEDKVVSGGFVVVLGGQNVIENGETRGALPDSQESYPTITLRSGDSPPADARKLYKRPTLADSTAQKELQPVNVAAEKASRASISAFVPDSSEVRRTKEVVMAQEAVDLQGET